jgi:hypothetical protein
LTGKHPIRPTSPRFRRSRRLELGRRSTYPPKILFRQTEPPQPITPYANKLYNPHLKRSILQTYCTAQHCFHYTDIGLNPQSLHIEAPGIPYTWAVYSIGYGRQGRARHRVVHKGYHARTLGLLRGSGLCIGWVPCCVQGRLCSMGGVCMGGCGDGEGDCFVRYGQR